MNLKIRDEDPRDHIHLPMYLLERPLKVMIHLSMKV